MLRLRTRRHARERKSRSVRRRPLKWRTRRVESGANPRTSSRSAAALRSRRCDNRQICKHDKRKCQNTFLAASIFLKVKVYQNIADSKHQAMQNIPSTMPLSSQSNTLLPSSLMHVAMPPRSALDLHLQVTSGGGILSDEKFEDQDICDETKRGISDQGFGFMSLIQAKTLKPLLAGRDLLAQAKTGSSFQSVLLMRRSSIDFVPAKTMPETAIESTCKMPSDAQVLFSLIVIRLSHLFSCAAQERRWHSSCLPLNCSIRATLRRCSPKVDIDAFGITVDRRSYSM